MSRAGRAGPAGRVANTSNVDDELDGIAAQPPAAILPYLYLSGSAAASELAYLKKFEIDVVINLTAQTFQFPHKDAVKVYKELSMDEESEDFDISEYFDQLYDIIADVKDKKQKALICDAEGKSLPATIALAYMLKASKKQDKYLPLKKAMEHVALKSPLLKPSELALLRLCVLEEELFEECSVKLTKGNGRHAPGKGRRGK